MPSRWTRRRGAADGAQLVPDGHGQRLAPERRSDLPLRGRRELRRRRGLRGLDQRGRQPRRPDRCGAARRRPRRHPGPHPDQTQAKAHQCPFDPSGRWIAVNDLGLDRTYVYGLDASSGKLVANTPPYVQYARGRGPRHIAFHPSNRFAYVINEL